MIRISIEADWDSSRVLRIRENISDQVFAQSENKEELLYYVTRNIYKQLEAEFNKAALEKELNREYCDY